MLYEACPLRRLFQRQKPISLKFSFYSGFTGDVNQKFAKILSWKAED